VYSAVVDAQNEFSFPQIPVSQYAIVPDPFLLSQHGLSAIEQNVDLIYSPQASTVIDIVKADSVSGTVSASDGETLPFAWLTIDGSSKAYAVDPMSGSFLISEIPTDAGYLTVSAPGYFSTTKHVADLSLSFDFQLVARPDIQQIKWGNGYINIPPETEVAVNGLAIDLDHGWLWGNGSDAQPITVTLPAGRVTILDADFAIDFPAEGAGWLYVRKGSAQFTSDGGQAPVKVGSGQMVALTNGEVQTISAERAVVMALHPALAEAPVSEIIEPSIGARVRTWLEKAGIGIAQMITFITYIISLVALPAILLFVLFSYWKRRKNLSSFKEKH
jgi:hypothetical protein